MANISVRLAIRIPAGTKSYVCTERHYLVNQTSLEAVQASPRIITDLVQERALCLGAGALMLRTSVYADDDARNSLTFPALGPTARVGPFSLPCYNPAFYSPSVNPEAPLTSDFGYSDLQVEKRCSNGATQTYYMAGWPDSFQVISVDRPNEPFFNAQWERWRTFLINGNYGTLTVLRGNANPERSVTAMVWDSVAGTYTVTCPNHGFLSGDQVVIRNGRVRIPNAVAQTASFVIPRGYKFVTVIDANTFQVRGYTPAYGTFTYLGGARAKKYARAISPYSGMGLIAFTSRKRGGRLFTPLGRRKVRTY